MKKVKYNFLMNKSKRSDISCPCCQSTEFRATAIQCLSCGTKIEASFEENEFASLNSDELHFLRVFINTEGKVKDMEKALGISYPSVKNKIGKLKEKLYSVHQELEATTVVDVLALMESGDINYDEGLALIKKIKSRGNGERGN